MDVYTILAQVTGLVGWLLLIYSYYKEDIDKLLYIQIISSIFYCINYFLLGAWSGLIVCFIELIKGIGYYKTDKDDLIFLVSLPVYVLMAIFSYDSILSLLPIIGSIIEGYTLTKNRNLAVAGSLVSNVIWVVYDLLILAFSCAITDSILVVSNISLLLLGYSRLLKTNKLRIEQGRFLTRHVYNSMYKLDEKSYGVDYTWTYEYEKEISKKNKDSLLIIKYDKEIVGYVSYLVLNELEYLNIMNSTDVTKYYDVNNIIDYKKSKKNYLIIDSININNKFHNHKAIDLIVKKLKRIITTKYKNGYKIESIISIALNTFEKEVLEKAGFSEYRKYSNNEILYMIDNKSIEELYLKNVNKRKDYYKYKVYMNEEVTEDMIMEIGSLYKRLFKEDFIWDIDYQLKVFNKNKKSMIMVKYEGKLIGYLNYLVINREKYNEILNSNETVEQYNLSDITTFHKGKSNYLVINSVFIDKKFQDGYTIKLLLKTLRKVLKQMHSDSYRITGINATAVSKDGMKVLENLGFNHFKVLNDGNVLFILEKKDLKKFL